ncbi:MAG: DNA polymerase III subunit gamma/tau [bacterium]|nr:DNA polymerase III subunit gamma/tau [bacterium]
MNTTVLYRKYRPKEWVDVIGQDHIVSVLEGSIKLERLSHAYLFCGSRGTGKTTVARIFARAMGVSDNDIYEIDAASNNGVDEMRLINEGVNTLPFNSPYKIYIFDEVHMFSKSAFNALLKTLEEPPAHVLFVLATTETEKIPETVVSRCQVFTFKRPTREILKQLVTNIAKKEGYVLEAGAADLIALLGDGSFRDTLGILQKVISSTEDKKVSIAEVEKITGAPKSGLVNDFISALAKKEKEKALAVLEKVCEGNIAMKTFAALVLGRARIILLSNDMTISSFVMVELLKAYDNIGRSCIESLPMELAVIEVCQS